MRATGLLLERFRTALSDEDKELLAQWFIGQSTPDDSDPFLRRCIRPNLTDCTTLGLLLEAGSKDWMLLDSVGGKILYQGCVKALNKASLKTE